jgi:hypothetical protein
MDLAGHRAPAGLKAGASMKQEGSEVNAIYPAHIAVRGFQHNLPTSWILDSIKQSLRTGAARRPAYTVWPSGEPLIVNIAEEHLDMWRRQYDDGVQPELPEGLVIDIDRILGVNRPLPSPGEEAQVDG